MPEQPLSQLALYTARPTVRLNGAEHDRITSLLSAMDLREEEHGLSALELRFTNIASNADGGADFAFEDEGTFKLGDRLAVYAGDESAPTEIFAGLVTGIEAEFTDSGAPMLTALAEDRLQQARMKRRTRTYDNQSLADVRRGAVDLALNSQLRRVTVLADLAQQVTEVTLTGWNPGQGQRITGRSSGSHQGPGQGRTGAEVLRDAIGARSHQLSHLAATTDGEANALADAAYDERQRRFVTANGTAEGNPAIRVGTHVTLAGLGPRFSNTYYVTRCRHRFDLNLGYETDFTAECAFFGRP